MNRKISAKVSMSVPKAKTDIPTKSRVTKVKNDKVSDLKAKGKMPKLIVKKVARSVDYALYNQIRAPINDQFVFTEPGLNLPMYVMHPGASHHAIHYSNIGVTRTPAFHTVLTRDFGRMMVGIANEPRLAAALDNYKLTEDINMDKLTTNHWKYYAHPGVAVPIGLAYQNGSIQIVKADGKRKQDISYKEIETGMRKVSNPAISRDMFTGEFASLNSTFARSDPDAVDQYGYCREQIHNALNVSGTSIADFVNTLWPTTDSQRDVHFFVFRDQENSAHPTFGGCGLIYLHTTRANVSDRDLPADTFTKFGLPAGLVLDGNKNFGIIHIEDLALTFEQAKELVVPSVDELKYMSSYAAPPVRVVDGKIVVIPEITVDCERTAHIHAAVAGWSVLAKFSETAGTDVSRTHYRIVGHADRMPGMILSKTSRADITAFERNVDIYSLGLMCKQESDNREGLSASSVDANRSLKFARYVMSIARCNAHEGAMMSPFNDWESRYVISVAASLKRRHINPIAHLSDNLSSFGLVPMLNVMTPLMSLMHLDTAAFHGFMESERAFYAGETETDANKSAGSGVDWDIDVDADFPELPPVTEKADVIESDSRRKIRRLIAYYRNSFMTAHVTIKNDPDMSDFTTFSFLMNKLNPEAIRVAETWLTNALMRGSLVWQFDSFKPQTAGTKIMPILRGDSGIFKDQVMPIALTERILIRSGVFNQNGVLPKDIMDSHMLRQKFITHYTRPNPATQLPTIELFNVISQRRHVPFATIGWFPTRAFYEDHASKLWKQVRAARGTADRPALEANFYSFATVYNCYALGVKISNMIPDTN